MAPDAERMVLSELVLDIEHMVLLETVLNAKQVVLPPAGNGS